MNTTKYLTIGVLTFVGMLVIGMFSSCINLYNQEVQLRNQIEAKQTENRSNFDNMWKKIKQATNVSDKYKDGLQEVMLAYTTGRQDKSDKMLMKWGAEAVPNFDSSLYKQLMNIVVSSRDDFTMNQKELIDLNRTHDTLLSTFPNNMFFSMLGIKKINIQVVTSTKTEETFKTGLDDDVEL